MPYKSHPMQETMVDFPARARRTILAALGRARGSIVLAARDMKVSKPTLQRWIDQLGMGGDVREARERLEPVAAVRRSQHARLAGRRGGWPKGRPRGPSPLRGRPMPRKKAA